METKNYLLKKTWEFKKTGNQFRVETCPLCKDDRRHFYINAENGLWDCKKCGSSGNLFQLKLKLGDIRKKPIPFQQQEITMEHNSLEESQKCLDYHQSLLSDQEAMMYLTDERKLEVETIKHFKLGVTDDETTKWLTIPHFSDGKLINIKYKSLPPAEKMFKREEGKPSILFNEDCLKDGCNEIFIAEGETDAMSLWQSGVKNVVGVTAGAGSFPADWCDKLEGIDHIYLCYDNDGIGQKGAYNAAQKLGFARCKNVILPEGQDLNDYLKVNTLDSLKERQEKAKKFSIPTILSVHDIIGNFSEASASNSKKEGIETGWDNVNKLIVKFEPGDLVALSAVPKTGKTTFALNIAYYNAINGIPCLFYCLEMRPERLLMKILSIKLDKEITQLDGSLMKEAKALLPNLPLYFGYPPKRLSLDSILMTMRNAAKRYEIRFAVFDNLNFVVRSTANVTNQIGFATQSFKLLAEELKIPIMLIAQARKKNPNEMIGMEDLRDSSLIGADADHIMIMHRERIKSDLESYQPIESAFSPMTIVRVEASRFHPGGDTVLNYDGAKSRFNRIDEEIKQ